MAQTLTVKPEYVNKAQVFLDGKTTLLNNNLTQEQLLAIYLKPEFKAFIDITYTNVADSFPENFEIDPNLFHAYDSAEITHNPAKNDYAPNTVGKAINENKASADAFIGGTLRPVTRPSFFLDFANTRFLDPKIPFSRNSIATYIDKYGAMRLAQANKPRFHHDVVTKECLGLLMESQRTNLLLKANDAENGLWFKTRCSVVNSTTKGVYATTARKIVCDGSSDPLIGQIVSVSNVVGYTYTFSVWLWTDEVAATKAAIKISGASSEQLNTKIVDVTNVPQMFEVSQTFMAGFVSPTINVRVEPFEGETDTPTAGRAMYIDCAQLELSNGYASSFIPTDNIAVTRAKDLIAISGTQFTELFPSVLEGTMLCSATKGKPNGEYPNYWIFSGANTAGGVNNIKLTNFLTPNDFTTAFNINGVNASNISFIVPVGNAFVNVFAWKKNDAKAYNNTVASADIAPASVPSNIERFEIQDVNGCIKQLAFWPRRIPNEVIQAMAKNTVSGKNASQIPSIGDLGSGAFMSPYGILRTLGKQLLCFDGTGASATRNIRFPFDFTFEVIDNSGVTTMTAAPAMNCLANTDNALTITAPVGKTLSYLITPIYEY